MANDLLNEQDLRMSTPQRWCKKQLMASTMLVWPSPFAQGRCCLAGSTLA